MGKQLINTFYFPKSKARDMDDAIVMLITKDANGKKDFSCIIPELTYYVTKPEYWPNEDDPVNIKYPKFIEEEKVIPITTKYSNLFKSITDVLNDENLSKYYMDALKSGSDIIYKLNRLHLDSRLHNTDVNIQDYYVDQFLQKFNYNDNLYPITKFVYDIEVDSSNIIGFPDPIEAECPINIITGIDMYNKKCYIYCLKYDNDTYRKTMSDIPKLIEKIKEKNNKILKYDLKYEIRQFKNEINLITKFFEIINEIVRPDFAGGWNSNGFDNPYILNRIAKLGYDPNDILCPQEMPYKYITHIKDNGPKSGDPAENNNTFTVVSYTNYIDMMNTYANLRKASGKKESYALDAIAEEELNVGKDKLDTDIKTAHLTDYKKFLLYNVQDTALLAALEDKNNDMDMIFNIAMLTHTRINKALKKTVCLRNFASIFYRETGAVISNNRSSLYPKMNEKIKGALVGNPLNIEHVGMKIDDRLSKFIFELVIDEDLASLYPSIMIAYNISSKTFLGKLNLITSKKEEENMEYIEIDKTDKFIDYYTSENYSKLYQKFFGIKSFDSILADFDEKYPKYKNQMMKSIITTEEVN